jgi:hypothetical protein
MNPGRIKLVIAFGAAGLFCPSQVTTTTRLGIIDGLGQGAAAASHAARQCLARKCVLAKCRQAPQSRDAVPAPVLVRKQQL